MDVNDLSNFLSEWFIAVCPSGADPGTVERILEGAIKTVFPRMLYTGRPPHKDKNGVLHVTVGLGMIPSMDRKLVAKAIATKAADSLTEDYTVSAVHLENAGEAPGVPVTKDKIQDKPFPGRDGLTGEPVGSIPSGVQPGFISALEGAVPQGTPVVDFEIKGRL